MDAVLGFRQHSFTRKALLKKVMDGQLDGFIGLRGGRETKQDKLSKLFSFVPQRSRVGLHEIGDATRMQIESLYEARDAPRVLQKYSERQYTLTKRYADYDNAGLLVMSSELFRWLVKERGLDGFDVVHFLAYRWVRLA